MKVLNPHPTLSLQKGEAIRHIIRTEPAQIPRSVYPPLPVRGERIEVRGRTKFALHSTLTLPAPFERERSS